VGLGTVVPFLVALTIHLHLPENGSLKGKRKELLSVRAGLARRFGASVAEVDDHDLWQRATLAAGLVSRTAGELERAADGIERYLLARYPDGVRVERRLVSFRDIDA
jgi:uncharacterized protein YlxP (DUF503 family)